MTTLTIKILLLIAFAAHLVTWRCDWLITCTPNGRFQFEDFKDNQKLSKLFEGAPLKNPMASIMAGVFSDLIESGKSHLLKLVGLPAFFEKSEQSNIIINCCLPPDTVLN